MLIGVATQGGECFQLAHSFQPYAERSSETLAASSQQREQIAADKKSRVQDANKKVVRRFEKLHPAIEFGDGPRSRNPLLLELRLQLRAAWAGERLALKTSQYLGEKIQFVAGFLSRMRCVTEVRAKAIGNPQVDHRGG